MCYFEEYNQNPIQTFLHFFNKQKQQIFPTCGWNISEFELRLKYWTTKKQCTYKVHLLLKDISYDFSDYLFDCSNSFTHLITNLTIAIITTTYQISTLCGLFWIFIWWNKSLPLRIISRQRLQDTNPNEKWIKFGKKKLTLLNKYHCVTVNYLMKAYWEKVKQKPSESLLILAVMLPGLSYNWNQNQDIK